MNVNKNKLLYFDIETVSKYSSFKEMSETEFKIWLRYYEKTFLKKVTNPERLDGLELHSDEHYEEVYQQTASFFAEFGKVACVSMAVTSTSSEGGLKYISYSGEDEKEILLNVRNVFDSSDKKGYHLCGQSVKFFDIPFLGKRFFINGLKAPKNFPTHETKPWEVKVLDLRDVWSFNTKNSIGSLDVVCGSLGLISPKNGDVKGDNVNFNYWKGNHDEIVEYCEKDVKALYDIVDFLTNLQ